MPVLMFLFYTMYLLKYKFSLFSALNAHFDLVKTNILILLVNDNNNQYFYARMISQMLQVNINPPFSSQCSAGHSQVNKYTNESDVYF